MVVVGVVGWLVWGMSVVDVVGGGGWLVGWLKCIGWLVGGLGGSWGCAGFMGKGWIGCERDEGRCVGGL